MKNKKIITGEQYTQRMFNSLSYIGILPNPDKILRHTAKAYESLRELKSDPHLWSCIQSRKSGLLSLEWELQPNGAAEQITAKCSEILSSLDIQRIERDIMEASLFGFQPFEIVWNYSDGFIVPYDILPKPQDWFSFDIDGNLRWNKSGSLGGEDIPPMKIICVQHESSPSNPYGDSLLSKCYWPVTFKKGALKFWVNFAEKYGMPFLIGQYQRGATAGEAQKLLEELSNMTEDAVIVAPSDIKVEMKEAVRSSSSNLYKDLIRFCNNEISKAILSQTLTTELDTGSYAATEIHYRVRQEVILADIRLVEQLFNTLIKFICKLNFEPSKFPRFKIKLKE